MNVLGLFAKLPVPGRTKTRLAADVGAGAAADLYAAFVRDLLSRCQSVPDELVVSITPQTAEAKLWFEQQMQGAGRIWFQSAGELGARIEDFFRTAFESTAFDADRSPSSRRVVLIGTDSPDLPTDLLHRAFQELEHHDLVIGPAADGGFTLVGMKNPLPGLWDNVRFSSASTLTDTLSAAAARRLSVRLLPLWYDIDTIENLGTLLSLQSAEHTAAACPLTLQKLQALNLLQQKPDVDS